MSSENDVPDFFKDFEEQIDYTQRLENAYMDKHKEVEYLYKKLKIMYKSLRKQQKNPEVEKIIREIKDLLNPDSRIQQEQLDVLVSSRKCLEDIKGNKKIERLVKRLDKNIDNRRTKKNNRNKGNNNTGNNNMGYNNTGNNNENVIVTSVL